jgi:ubiquinone/menaquinone biosynthesis C-methylase UbiE
MKDAFSFLNQLEVSLVLDAATGRGEFIHVLQQYLGSYTQIIGIDSSERSVNYAQKLFPENDVEIYKMDLEDLQFENSYFDLVCISNSIHHLQHRDQVFAEMLRVLKPGGTFLLAEMYSDGEQSEAQQTHILMHHWIASIDRRFGVFHESTFTREELLRIVKKLKLKKLNVQDFYIPVDNPQDAKHCENLRRTCEEAFKRVESLEDRDVLLEEGQKLVDRINTIGCASASRLLITGLKP